LLHIEELTQDQNLKQQLRVKLKEEVKRQNEEKLFVQDLKAGQESVEKQLEDAGDVKKNYYYICYK
jgi:hypothetical protein